MLFLCMKENLWAESFLMHGGGAGDGLAHSEGKENDCLYPVQMQRSQSLFDELWASFIDWSDWLSFIAW